MVWFDEADLRRQAGNTLYVRGLGYLNEVVDLCWSPSAVTATVCGSNEYQVRLSNSRGWLSGNCSCPWGQKGNFCKHCVAVGLAALNAAPSQPLPPEPPAPEPPTLEPSTHTPGSEDAVDRRASLLELARRNPPGYRLVPVRSRRKTFDPEELYPMVDALRRTWRLGDVALARLCLAADDVLSTLDKFATAYPAAIRPLYQRVARHLIAPDFDGQAYDNLAAIRDAVTRAVNGVIAASRAEPPDPVEFAKWLIDVQIKRDSRSPDLPVGQFVEILGDEGLAGYWQRLSDMARRAAVSESEEAPSRRRAIFQLRETYLIDIAKDVDRLVGLYSEDLSDPNRYMQIGETFRAAERFDEAIAWLQRGLAEARWERTKICDLLVAVYTQTGCLKEAARTRLDNFSREPNEYNYRMLLRAAEAIDAVPYAEERAMILLRERATRGGWNADPLVKILIAIDEIDQAWAAAREFACSSDCMFLLARNRAKHHPADAIPIYEREVDNAIASKDRSGYATAAELLVSLRDLHKRAGSDFSAYLDHIKSTHRRKVILMNYLADARL